MSKTTPIILIKNTYLICPICSQEICNFSIWKCDYNLVVSCRCMKEHEDKCYTIINFVQELKTSSVAKPKSKTTQSKLNPLDILCLKCIDHDEVCTLFCNECNENICQYCIEFHQSHTFIEIGTIDLSLISKVFYAFKDNSISNSNKLLYDKIMKLLYQEIDNDYNCLYHQWMLDIENSYFQFQPLYLAIKELLHIIRNTIKKLDNSYSYSLVSLCNSIKMPSNKLCTIDLTVNDINEDLIKKIIDELALTTIINYDETLENNHSIKSIDTFIEGNTVFIKVNKNHFVILTSSSITLYDKNVSTKKWDYNSLDFSILNNPLNQFFIYTFLADMNISYLQIRENEEYNRKEFKDIFDNIGLLDEFKNYYEKMYDLIDKENIVNKFSDNYADILTRVTSYKNTFHYLFKNEQKFYKNPVIIPDDLDIVIRIIIHLNNGMLGVLTSKRDFLICNIETSQIITTVKSVFERSMIQLKNNDFAMIHRENIRIYNQKTYQIEMILKGHSDKVSCLYAMGNGYLASGSHDQTIKIWNVYKKNCLSTSTKHHSFVSCILQLENGNLISTSAHIIQVWNYDMKNNSFCCIGTVINHVTVINCLIELNDKSFASCSVDKTVTVWSIKDK